MFLILGFVQELQVPRLLLDLVVNHMCVIGDVKILTHMAQIVQNDKECISGKIHSKCIKLSIALTTLFLCFVIFLFSSYMQKLFL